jgi:2-methylfumaryl-CoA isomerase
LAALGFVDEGRLAAEPRRRDGNYLYGAFGRDFVLADGSRVMIVAITLKQWRALVAALDLTDDVAELERSSGLDLEREGDRFRARREIAGLVESWCSTRHAEKVAEVLGGHGVCWSFYGSATEFADEVHPETVGDLACSSALGARFVRDLGLPFRFDDETPRSLGTAPALGQDTELVLAEILGLSQREIGRLHDDGLVAITGRSGDSNRA